ncbi:MAG: Mbeg1-like protein [Lachnospiraceae bacterium]
MREELCCYFTRRFLEEQLLYLIVMYLPFEALEIGDGESLGEIVRGALQRLSQGGLSDSDRRKVEQYLPYMEGILARRKELGNSRIGNLSWLDYDEDGRKDHPPNGLVAAVFVNRAADSLFVAFRGTPKGAWLDNAKMLIGDLKYCRDFKDLDGNVWRYLSPMQAEAMEYVRELVTNRRKVWDQAGRHYVIGHSKGGNQVQLAIMLFPDYFDVGISMDGPGMSEEAIREMEDRMGAKLFEQALGRLIGVNAYNDYVHGLGLPLIPCDQNFWFLETACTPVMLCSHFVTALLAGQDGGMVPFNADGPGPAAVFMRRLSDEAMAMPPADRADVFMTVMAVMQAVLGKSLPVNARQEDWIGLIAGFEDGSIKAANLLSSVLKESMVTGLEHFSN